MPNDGRPRIELSSVPPGVLRVLNESLGEGEVSVRITPRNGDAVEIRIQETVFAGVWRELHVLPDGAVEHDWLLACPVPPVALERAQRAATTHLAAVEMPRGAMNSPALLTEIREQVLRFRPGQPPHVINLTLLPLTQEDQAVLEQAAPVGPVAILSRGFGNCRITSTALRNLWRVQYFNSMQTMILNTFEVVEVPEVAMAAAEDLLDSRERLCELLDWMADSGSA
jgi:hydrogenase-1 operon protein HyaF